MDYRQHPYQNQYHPYAQPPFQPPFYTAQQHYQIPLSQQPQSPFEQFAKPKQPHDWYSQTQNQQEQGNYQQSYGSYPAGLMSQFQDQNGQLNLDKLLSTVSQIANTYHQVSPIIKQFGTFMKTFR